MPLLPALALARQLIEGRLKNGGRALDGTAGNGRDTLFLAQLAGGSGKVWAFDIQAQALSNTTGLLRENGVEGQVELIAASHADLADYVREPLDAAMFNFGYLPGGDKTVTTTADSSVRAMQDAPKPPPSNNGWPPCRRNNIKSCTTALPTSATIRRNCWP